MQRNYLTHCTVRMRTEKWKEECVRERDRKRERHQKISEVGNLEKMIDGTNKIRDISKRPN